MKKLISVLLILSLNFSMVSCGQGSEETAEDIADTLAWIAAYLIIVDTVNNPRNINGYYYYYSPRGCNNTYVYYDNYYSEVYVDCDRWDGRDYIVTPRFYNTIEIYRYR